MSVKITWKKFDRVHGDSLYGFVGKWQCFEIVWDSFSKKDPEKPYKLLCTLPGLKDHLGNFSHEGAEAKAAKVLALWIDGMTKERE